MISYIYTFIRKDLSPEQRIIQIGHACFEAGKRFGDSEIQNLVLLEAKDQNDLKQIAWMLECRNIEFYMFHEPDFNMGFSAICTKPIYDSDMINFFRRWNLFVHTS
jgi:hypothetical protein